MLVNTDLEKENSMALRFGYFKFQISNFKFELLGQPLPKISASKERNPFHASRPARFLPCASRISGRIERRKITAAPARKRLLPWNH